MRLISFIVSVLDEQETIGILCDEIRENIPLGDDYQIILIDDGSHDDSYARMDEQAKKDKKVQVVKFQRNFGKAAAIQKGFELAKGEVVITLDADLQDNPKEIGKFLDKAG